MKNIDKIIKETIRSSIVGIIKESSDSFDNYLNEFDKSVKDYFEKERILLNNRESYYSTVRSVLISSHNTIMNLDFSYSLVDKDNSFSDRLTVRYFIHGSMNWSDDELYDNEDKLYHIFEMKNLDELNIDITLKDMRDKGGECFIELSFDIDSISGFEF